MPVAHRRSVRPDSAIARWEAPLRQRDQSKWLQ
jgi:hypothetical protein